jgi:serine/threonine-protein kinase
MFCNHCGAQNADGSRFCVACGGAITSPGGKQPAAAMAPDTEFGLPAGALLANRYRILAVLGMGGMGRVYLAEDEKLETRVAIKVLREVLSRDPGSVKRLIAEARHSMALSHPNVVRVHNFEDGELVKFLIMEYVDGETLAARLAARGKLDEAEARRIAIETCKGLEHAHEQKVVHRDIKPANIMLAKSGAVKIADFGIARECRDSVSRLTSQVDSGNSSTCLPSS